jgi:D-glycero-D-manno-heptose 1,7-bisphosphate phosphatase
VKKAVFLDRDGVINRSVVRDGKPFPPGSLAEVDILPGVEGALALLRRAGYLNIVVTNQPDVRSGKQRLDVVEAMHRRLLGALALDEIRACYHIDEDGCNCRKPKPGLLLAAAREHDIDLAGSFMVGDRWRDVLAGQTAGCRVFFIDLGYQEQRPEPPYTPVRSLLEAAQAIVLDASAQ